MCRVFFTGTGLTCVFCSSRTMPVWRVRSEIFSSARGTRYPSAQLKIMRSPFFVKRFFDLALLDVSLAQGNGFAVCAAA